MKVSEDFYSDCVCWKEMNQTSLAIFSDIYYVEGRNMTLVYNKMKTVCFIKHTRTFKRKNAKLCEIVFKML